MSKQTREFFERLKTGEQLRAGEQSIGVVEAIKEGVQAVAPGLSFSKMLHDIGAELKQIGAHGSHEMAATLFNGSAFVMYPRAPREGQRVEDQQHGLTQEAQKEQSRGMEI